MPEIKGQMSIQDIWCGKMSPEHSAAMAAKISEPSLKKRQGLPKGMPAFLDLRGDDGHMPEPSWEMDGVSLGELMTHNITECRRGEEGYVCLLTLMETPHQEYYLNCSEKPLMPKPTKLSEILERMPDAKFNLSPRACAGILRRAERRGKILPQALAEALKVQAGLDQQ